MKTKDVDAIYESSFFIAGVAATLSLVSRSFSFKGFFGKSIRVFEGMSQVITALE